MDTRELEKETLSLKIVEELAREVADLRTQIAEKDRMLAEAQLRVRYLMWMNHGHTRGYGDDGEMQCSACAKYGCWDYRNAPMEEVNAAYQRANMDRIRALASTTDGGK